jgi:phosphoribosylformimino-5-aminoimidazole carboxamide ribotide isomerase
MIIFPAIDLKDGQCVRLEEGRMDAATVFNEDPAAQAAQFQAAGFSWLHLVDLDGAIAGAPKNVGAVNAILQSAAIPVQMGGGVRTLETVQYWIEAGVSRVVIGTAAARDPELVRTAARVFPERIAVSLDARDGLVAVSGWVEQTDLDAIELAKRLEDAGAAAFIVTDIARDGLKTGVNVDLVAAMADAVHAPVIASGGVSGVHDIAALKAKPGRDIHGAIIGRALYDGTLTPAAALAAARGQ